MGRKQKNNETPGAGSVKEMEPAAEPAGERGAGWSSRRAEAVDRMIQDLERKFWEKDFRASVGDYIRLIQIRKELDEERPKEIIITWVDPSEDRNVSA
jgi:hypothetical protein